MVHWLLPNPKRRAALASLLSLSFSAEASSSRTASQDRERSSSAKVLVTYFSRSGNTRVIAGLLHRKLNTDLFEIKVAKAYPDDYLETVELARHERDNNLEPQLDRLAPRLESYDTVYLGFPIWGETAPPPIRTFLSTHDLAGKTVIPFITHGGYGLGQSLTVLRNRAKGAHLREPFVLEADQERRTMNQVHEWLSRAQASR